jgi:hypothetical protein
VLVLVLDLVLSLLHQNERESHWTVGLHARYLASVDASLPPCCRLEDALLSTAATNLTSALMVE